MKIFDAIRGGNGGPACRDCAYFQNDPALIEKVFCGLTVMSSGFASVRDEDGFCDYHELYLSARDGCQCFTPRVSAAFNFQMG